jgi:hypothetical protein
MKYFRVSHGSGILRMKCCRVSRRHGNLQLTVSAPPLASGIHSPGAASLRAISPSQPPRGGPGHLQLPVKHDNYSFCVIESIRNLKTRLAGVAVGSLLSTRRLIPNTTFCHAICSESFIILWFQNQAIRPFVNKRSIFLDNGTRVPASALNTNVYESYKYRKQKRQQST